MLFNVHFKEKLYSRNPTPEGSSVKLNEYTVAERHFVDINNDGLVTGLGPNQRQNTFWDELYEKYSKLFANEKAQKRKEEL